jgi:AraC family transcriptional regulator of adaptative response/methylated-DNA-[protein]-cysteine methyltransferase
VCAIALGDDIPSLTANLRSRFPEAKESRQLDRLLAHVIASVEAPTTSLEVPLELQGTAFQKLVWQALQEIPAGTTATYTEVAVRIGAPGSVRAVASACAANPIAVAVPCHRVVRSDGGLAGYRWGLARKRELLAREAQA